MVQRGRGFSFGKCKKNIDFFEKFERKVELKLKLNVCYLETVEYEDALHLQERLHKLRVENRLDDTLLLLQHPPVITIGRRGKWENILVSKEKLLQMGVKVFEVTRGGDVTYHGPGQIVGYPIFDLGAIGKDIKRFVWLLEEVFINLLKDEYGIEAYRDEKQYTGVWVGEEKIVAIGIAVRKWITMHGFAFNVNTNLEHFSWIIPCGLKDRGVTSLERLLGHKVEFDDVVYKVAKYFGKVFGAHLRFISKEDLEEIIKIKVEDSER